VRIEREGVARPHHPDRDAGRRGLLEQLTNAPRPALHECRRHHDLTDGESLQQAGDSIEVVGVGVGDDEGVDPADPFVPKHAGHRAAGSRRAAEPTGVVEERAAGRRADDDPTAMPDGRHDHPQARDRRGADSHRGGPDEADAAPDGCRDHPGAQLPQPDGGQEKTGGQQPGMPSPDPPARRCRQPDMAPGHPRAPGHAGLDHGERRIASHAAAAGERRGDRGEHEAPHAAAHRRGHERSHDHVEHDPQRAHDVKPGDHQRRRDRPDCGAGEQHGHRLPPELPEPALGTRPTSLDEPLDRVGLLSCRGDGMGHADEHGRRQKRELRAHARDFRRPPDEQDNRGAGEGVEPG